MLKFDTRVLELAIEMRILDFVPLLRVPLFLAELMVFALHVAFLIFFISFRLNGQKVSFWNTLFKKLFAVNLLDRLFVCDYLVK